MRTMLVPLLLMVALFVNACTLRERPTQAGALPTAALEALSPLPTPTAVSADIAPVTPTVASIATVTPTVPVTTSAAAELTQVKVMGADGLITCLPEGEFMRCHDSFLDLDYEYPAFLGQITGGSLRPGGYAGQGYGYELDDATGYSDMGGRSRDYSEGRGPMFTDQGGFCNSPVESRCHFLRADLCETVKPGVVLMGIFPKARSFCVTHYNFGVSPALIVVADLPMHPTIHGMAFASFLLPPDAEANYKPTDQNCSTEAQATYDRQMEEMRQAVQAGTAEPGIQARYDAMMRLAESISGSYLEACVSLQATPSAGSDQNEGFVCPVTQPNGNVPPYEEPWSLWYGDGQMWTYLWPESTITIGPDRIQDDGKLAVRLVWWRNPGEELTIRGRRLDADAPPLEAEIPKWDRESPGQRSDIFFPSAGCWEVTGQVGDHELTFVTRVVQVALP